MAVISRVVAGPHTWHGIVPAGYVYTLAALVGERREGGWREREREMYTCTHILVHRHIYPFQEFAGNHLPFVGFTFVKGTR